MREPNTEPDGVTVALDDDVAVPLGEDDGGAYTQLRLNRPLTPPCPAFIWVFNRTGLPSPLACRSAATHFAGST